MAKKSAVGLVMGTYTDPWPPNKTKGKEDILLHKYYKKMLEDPEIRGTIYAEVHVKPVFESETVSTEIKRVDAIFIPEGKTGAQTPDSYNVRIVKFRKRSKSPDEDIERGFLNMIKDKNIVLAEIKDKLNFEAIGQVLSYEVLVKENYPVNEIQKLIICKQRDPELLSTLEKYGIELLELR